MRNALGTGTVELKPIWRRRLPTIRFGCSDRTGQRPLWRCSYLLKDGSTGHHKSRGGVVPRLLKTDPVCRDCGQPLETWRGVKVHDSHWYPAKPITDALVQMANGGPCRKVAADLRLATNRQADALERRRAGTLNLIYALNQTGDPGDAQQARKIQCVHPYRVHSREAGVSESLLQTFAPPLRQALAPQSWPEVRISAPSTR